ncbi:Uncharacterized protein ABC855_g4272 [[Candida] zeylanoides]
MSMAHVFTEIVVERSHVSNCSYSQWSRLFPSHVHPARVFKPLPQAFLDYLESDSIKLPANELSPVLANSDNEYSDWSDSDAEGELSAAQTHSSGPGGATTTNPVAAFEDLHIDISRAIEDLGSVTPKLNWSSPKDAKWILPNSSTRCFSADDVYLLLNASDHIVHDIDHAFDGCKQSQTSTDYELVLKKWIDINPALEFRVFVKNNAVSGISQRDLNFYDYLEGLRTTIVNSITSFCTNHVIGTFPDSSFVIDVYLPRPFDKVWIIDINPFSRTTDSLLFTWHEITEAMSPQSDVQLRLVTEHNVGRFAAKEHSENYVPRDIVDASLDASAMADLAREWSKLTTTANETA